MAFNTLNPIDSSDPRDLFDNAAIFDQYINASTPFVPDRFKVNRLTLGGMRYNFEQSQSGRTVAFQQFLRDSAFEVPVAYAAGLTLERASQTFVRDGVQYRIADPADLAYTLTGNWPGESGRFVSMSSDMLSDAERTRLRSLSVCVDSYITEGMIDHAPAFQAAIDTGAPLVVCSGLRSYDIATTVNLRSNQAIDLCGSVINVTASTMLDAAFFGLAIVNQKMRGGTINCNGMAKSGVRAHSGDTGCDALSYTWLRITGTANDPTLQYGGIEVASRDGLAGARNANVMIAFCEFVDVGTHGSLVYVTDSGSFVNNMVDGSPNHGMEFVACNDCIQTANRIFNCTLSALGVGAGTIGFVMSGNFARNCGGDGTFTVEHNSIDGVVSCNVGLDCNTSGINISHGESGASTRLRNISAIGNVLRQKSGISNYIGINAYASTGIHMGSAVFIQGNTVDGFTRPIEYRYFEDGLVSENIIDGSTVNFAVLLAHCTRVKVKGNICSADTLDHSFQALNYGALICDLIDFDDNSTIASGTAAKSLIYIEGAGTHRASANRTGGSLHFVECLNTATVYTGDNWGALAGTPYEGGTTLATLSGRTSLTVGTAGPAAALPANPEGYLTIFNPQVGQVKVPYYKTGSQ
ncbi:hypothetical protein SAMN05216588_12467 [Pseudomonas flavescens]|uniref:Right handed beta helix region n=1 Tax=Phytopseudomonas flavescens TaxID=29435 RepID=A0A1G8NCI5_9GAMM|nr:right-handed parallel beta-helix repeat-containing protein [Pseudomonas flavescens]SDI77872.1 hypothetical protein SAMN05216588_12467 [Pseudomonas flavescens]